MRLLRPLLVLGAACTLVVSLSGQTVRVLSVSGEATLQAPGDSIPRTVKKGDTIVVGTRIITGENARVILTPLPGVNSIIAPKSEIVVERVSVSNPSAGTKTALHSAVLDLKTGAVTTDLKPTEGVELDYGVRTARGLAGARGTTYTVALDAAGIQAIVVADGRISLTLADGRIVDLVPGQISLTRTDGTTQAVTSASALSTGDQAIADNWVQVTLDALVEAVDQGIAIDPEALEDAARAARELGIDIDAETQARLDRARDLLAERQVTAFETQTGGGSMSDNNDSETIVSETANPETPVSNDAYAQARAAYRLSLTEPQLATFDTLPDSAQRPLVTVNDSDFTSYALDPYGEGQTRPVASITYAGNLSDTFRAAFLTRSESLQDFLVAHPTDSGLAAFALTSDGENVFPADYVVTYYGDLSSGQRSSFRNLDASLREELADLNNSSLTGYALATGRSTADITFALSLNLSSELPAFLALPGSVQAKLVEVNDAAFTAYALAQDRTTVEIGFAYALSTERRTVFLGLDESVRDTLVTANDPALNAYALDLYGENQTRRPEADIFYFAGLTTAQRDSFLALPDATRDALVAAADPSLTGYALTAGRTAAEVDYALALPADRRALFLTYSPAAQAALVTRSTDTALADYAYATNEQGGNLHSHAAIAFYADLSTELRELYLARPADLQELAATDTTFANLLLASYSVEGTLQPEYSDITLRHYLAIASPEVREAYLDRPADIRDLLATANKPGLTTAILDPATFTETPTDTDLRRNLAALVALSPENQALFETFAGGPSYAKIDDAPSPYDWSDAAWTRTRNSFNSLDPATQNRLLNLGAIEGLFDYSGTFIETALADYDATLSSAERTAINSAGWGRHFADYFAKDEFRALLALAADFTPAELATLKQFGISPGVFGEDNREVGVSADTPETSGPLGADAKANLATLAALPVADRALLSTLSPGDGILFASLPGYYDEASEQYVYPTFAEALANALEFARSLPASDLDTLRDLGLGYQLLQYRATDTVYVGDSPTPAGERLAYLIGLYRGLDPARRELALDLRLFGSAYLGDSRLDTETVNLVLDSLASVSGFTRDYLAYAHGYVSLLDLVIGGGEYGYYSLTDLDNLLASLTEAEFATLRELRPGSALLVGNSEDGGLISASDLKSFLGYVAALGDLQRFTLNELGITKDGNDRKGLFLSDHEGLGRLLQAYSELPAALRVATRQLDPYDANNQNHTGRSFFFASDDGYDFTTYNVTFSSPDDLHVGATRRLSIIRYSESETLGDGPATFTVPDGKDVYLRASTLIDLNGVTFSNGVRAITMEAATLNLANLDFPEGSVVALNSKLGGMGTGNRYPNFDGSSIPGRVNFLYNVSYGGAQMFDEASFDSASRGNIVIGTLQNRALIPNYTGPSEQALKPNP